MLCWLIPLVAAFLSYLILSSYRRRMDEYRAQHDELARENKRLTSELAEQKDIAQSAIQRNLSEGDAPRQYNSAVYDAGMRELVQIEQAAKSGTVNQIQMAPAQSHALANLKQDVQRYQLNVASVATEHQPAYGAVQELTATDISRSQFLTEVVGADASKIKKSAKEIAAQAETARVAQPQLSGFDTNTGDRKSSAKAIKKAKADTKEKPKKSTSGMQSSAFDKKAVRAIMGKTVKLDDLTVVEGIGPKISGLFKDAGITTWQALSETSVARCQEILDAAGSRYRVHKPDTWPDQAKLAATGQWETLARLQDELQGGRKA